ncbi:hypothetical protein OROGR_008143 [Orobanche gracilis]
MSRFPPLSPPRNAARPAIVLPPLSLSGRNHFLPGQALNRSSSALVKVSAAIAANKHRKDRNRSSSALSGLEIILYVEAEKENSLDGIFYKVVEYLLNMSRKLRNYIDEKNLIFSEETKEAKSKVKCLRQNFVGRQISDATRIDPVFLDDGGQIFWKLKRLYCQICCFIKVHDVDGTATEEKWFVCDLEIKHEIDKYSSSSQGLLELNLMS